MVAASSSRFVGSSLAYEMLVVVVVVVVKTVNAGRC